MSEQINQLFEMLTYKRPHGSEGEKAFVERFIIPVATCTYMDTNGGILAYGVEIGELSSHKRIFSGHVDSVHRTSGIQKVDVDAGSGYVYLGEGETECLGADDASGVWLMLRMIEAGVPGLYLFHRGEEVGGIGSKGMRDHFSEELSQATHAIAFDRMDNHSIITHQMVGMCASQKFALDLAERFKDRGITKMRPDDTGSFTDTANYAGLIAECTNISIGYNSQHTKNEMQDYFFLQALAQACCDASMWDNMIVDRAPGEDDYIPDVGFDKWNAAWDRHAKGYDTPDEYTEITDMTSVELDNLTGLELIRLIENSVADDIADCIQNLIWEAKYARKQRTAA